jgi:replication-associated recombination protein RarA
MASYRRLTQNSYELSDVISALQKDIRRGNEENAMYWAYELIPQFEFYLWRRLVVIANEDIGIAEPTIFMTIAVLRDQFFEFRKDGRNGTARLILANAILTMCRAKKSRISDHFQRYMMEEWQNGRKREIPDYALDKHTSRGRTMKRGVQHWLDEGCLLIPEGDVPDPYAETAQEHWLNGRDKAAEWGQRSLSSLKTSGPPTLFNFMNAGDDDVD